MSTAERSSLPPQTGTTGKAPSRRQGRDEKLYQAKLTSLELFVRVIAHDLNGPLTGLNLTLQACRKIAKNPSMLKLLDSMDHDISSAAHLLEELKSLNRRDIFRTRKLDAAAEIRDLADQISANPRVPLVIETVPSGEKLFVAGDLPRLRRVWQNIILNVMDATLSRKNGDPVRLTISTRRTGKFARVQFSDNAGGIPKSKLLRIFEPFFTTKGEKNRGLGLFIARKIISEHNGKIRVISKKPFTRVTIDLPLLSSVPSSSTVRTETPSVSPATESTLSGAEGPQINSTEPPVVSGAEP